MKVDHKAVGKLVQYAFAGKSAEEARASNSMDTLEIWNYFELMIIPVKSLRLQVSFAIITGTTKA